MLYGSDADIVHNSQKGCLVLALQYITSCTLHVLAQLLAPLTAYNSFPPFCVACKKASKELLSC